MNLKDLRINARRLQGTLEEMARIGATPGGGVHRLTLTDEDKQARDLFVRWLKEMNLEVNVDEMGNIFGRRTGRNNGLPPVMSGSHIEQGPLLEREGKRIGAPKGILCLHWYDIYLAGEANQVGPTPMEGRHDALCAAAAAATSRWKTPGGKTVKPAPTSCCRPSCTRRTRLIDAINRQQA